MNDDVLALFLELAALPSPPGEERAVADRVLSYLRDLGLVFTPKEEVGLKGAYAFDASRLAARTGFVYDQQGPIGEIVLGTPTARALMLRFHGRAAHAGMVPEEGRSAIAAASRAVADMRLGRLDEVTTANVGQITGGSARNIVPEWCTLEAEARSHDLARLDD